MCVFLNSPSRSRDEGGGYLKIFCAGKFPFHKLSIKLFDFSTDKVDLN